MDQDLIYQLLQLLGMLMKFQIGHVGIEQEHGQLRRLIREKGIIMQGASIQ